MPKISISLADRIESDIDRLIEQGEFVNRDQAVEELLTMGVSAYETTEEATELAEDDLFSQTVEDQQDPAIHDDDPDEGYTF
ncbi:CopG family transcriptional regulator [Halorhabdus sp. CBA1104]|uniref:DUF7120 family protein n=1 Tax=unclassified Halorhabdus TaxID=2621901 RepID=UPI0012B24D14|nr:MULTISPECIES: CopG family transcriptional regulator [unclassified Halorhabdus]QGN07578.1 CopG family transcriptional regulator [Halorhabdus sp. CBA1104]